MGRTLCRRTIFLFSTELGALVEHERRAEAERFATGQRELTLAERSARGYAIPDLVVADEGLGFGGRVLLHLARRLVELYIGHLVVEARPPNSGVLPRDFPLAAKEILGAAGVLLLQQRRIEAALSNEPAAG